MVSFLEKRHQILRNGIDFNQDQCLEIGALVDPILHSQEGNVFYADHLSTEDLKKQFAWDEKFDLDRLVQVNFVWDNHHPFKECVDREFDYVVASHVGEHVPNLIGWIDQISQVLTPKGQLRLVLPDGRYSFDMKRQESRLSDLLATWMKKSYCPETHLVLDFALNKVDDQLVQEMHRRYIKDFDAADLPSQFPFHEVLEWGERTLDSAHYEDVHCWVLHLNLLASFMIVLTQHDILNVACAEWHDINPPHSYEFMVFMTPEDNKEKRVNSWKLLYNQTKANICLHQKPADQEIITKLQQENVQLKEELHSMYFSSSWRITSPLRAIMKLLRG